MDWQAGKAGWMGQWGISGQRLRHRGEWELRSSGLRTETRCYATGIQGRSRQVDRVAAALTVETHIMIGEDGWTVPFGRAPDHHMQKAIRRLNVMFLEETDGTGHSGSWRMRWWSP